MIEKITFLPVPGAFHRPVAMNAYGPKPGGKAGQVNLVRVFLSDGAMGLGVQGYVGIDESTRALLKQIIGLNPLEFHQWDGDRIIDISPAFKEWFGDARLGWLEAPLLDLIGKLKGKPVYQLFGTKVREGVDCYDGSLYFVDIEKKTGPEIIGRIAAQIKQDGYRAIKMKVGRTAKWLPGEAGVVRDIEVFISAREAVGSNFNLMTDANNGYQSRFELAVRFCAECAPYDMYWIEELFPENLDDYRKLRETLAQRNALIPIAEGESVRRMEDFVPYLEANLYNYIQPDMRTVGFSRILWAADLAARYGCRLVPHNWMSEFGKLMSIHASLIRTNIPFVEDDRFQNFALDSSAYAFRDGQWFFADRPGWGVELSPLYERFAAEGEETILTS